MAKDLGSLGLSTNGGHGLFRQIDAMLNKQKLRQSTEEVAQQHAAPGGRELPLVAASGGASDSVAAGSSAVIQGSNLGGVAASGPCGTGAFGANPMAQLDSTRISLPPELLGAQLGGGDGMASSQVLGMCF